MIARNDKPCPSPDCECCKMDELLDRVLDGTADVEPDGIDDPDSFGLRGGQGRSAADVDRTGMVLVWVALYFFVVLAVATGEIAWHWIWGTR